MRSLLVCAVLLLSEQAATAPPVLRASGTWSGNNRSWTNCNRQTIQHTNRHPAAASHPPIPIPSVAHCCHCALCGGCVVVFGQLAADYWQLARQVGRRAGNEADKQRIRDEYTESAHCITGPLTRPHSSTSECTYCSSRMRSTDV